MLDNIVGNIGGLMMHSFWSGKQSFEANLIRSLNLKTVLLKHRIYLEYAIVSGVVMVIFNSCVVI